MLRIAGMLVMAMALVGGCATAPTTSVPATGTSSPSPQASPQATAVSSTGVPAASAPAPTSTPTRPPSLPPAPTPAPLADGWPVSGVSGAVVGADGTAYAWMTDAGGNRVIAALDESGTMRLGWPFRPTTPYSDGSLVAAPDGSLLVGVSADRGARFVLHRVGRDGRELAGWPYRDDSVGWCEGPVVAADRTVAIACPRTDGSILTITRIDVTGRVIPGWPLTLDGVERLGGSWGEGIQLGSDGTVYALGIPSDLKAPARLWAFAPDGTRREGFPVTLAAHWAGYQVVSPARVLIGSYLPPVNPNEGLCSEARETIIGELDGNGRMVAGWPVSAVGWASDPAIGADGTVYYLTRDRVIARAPDGSLRAGWPVAIAPVYPECAKQGPYLGPDGTVYVMADGLRAFDRDGREQPGWPFRPANGFAGPFCEVDSSGVPSPALGSGGRVYAAVLGSGGTPEQPGPLQVVAVDAGGRLVPGWPYTLPAPGLGQVERLTVVDGRLYVALQRCTASDSTTVLLALDPAGAVSD